MASALADVLADERMAVETPEHVAIEYPLGGPGSRYCALLIDLFLVGVLLVGGGLGLLWIVIEIGPMLPAIDGMADVVFTLAIFGAFGIAWGYFFCFEAFSDGRTPGKRLLGLRAVMDGGHALTLEAAAIRNLIRPLDLLGGGIVGGLAILLTTRLQRLGDLAAGTVVVRELPSEFPVIGDAIDVGGEPRLDAATFGMLETWTDRRDGLAADARRDLAARLAARIRAILPSDAASAQALAASSDEALLQTVYDDERTRRLASRLGGVEARPAAQRLLRSKRERWEAFRALALRARRRGLASLDEAAVAGFAARYRELTADLARARTYGASPQTLFALERVVGIGHNVLYRPARRSLDAARSWLVAGFPTLVRRRWPAMAVATALFVLPAVVTFGLVHADPTLEDRLLPTEMLVRADEAPARKAAAKGYIDMVGGGISSSFLMTHNMGVAFNTFAGGILAGAGSALLLVANGLFLGAVLAAYASRGVLDLIGVFVLPHGVVELPALVIAGGAGLWMGSALLLPGRLTRRAALAERAPEAVSLIAGVMLLLTVAGLIEGYVSPSALPDGTKLVIAALMACGLVAYLSLGAAPAVTTDRDV